MATNALLVDKYLLNAWHLAVESAGNLLFTVDQDRWQANRGKYNVLPRLGQTQGTGTLQGQVRMGSCCHAVVGTRVHVSGGCRGCKTPATSP